MTTRKSSTKEQTLEDKLWETAELLRGKIAPSSYKDIALGLLFLKFITYWYDQRRKKLEKLTQNPKSKFYCKTEKQRDYTLNQKDSYSSEGIFFLKKGNKWDDLTKVVSSEKNLAITIDKMIRNIEEDNPQLENVLPKAFAGSGIPNDNLHQLIETFDGIPSNDISKDFFGRIYEYFLRNFSKKLGQKRR